MHVVQAQVIELESAYIRQYHELEDEKDPGLPWLEAVRREGLERFSEAGFPGPREEAWRFTDLKPLRRTVFAYGGRAQEAGVDPALAGEALGKGLAIRLTFANGIPLAPVPDPLPRGPELLTLEQALERCPERVEPLLGRIVRTDRHRFGALNNAFLREGAVVFVPKNQVVDAPIHLLFLNGAGGTPLVFHPHVLVILAEGARAVIVEEHLGGSDSVYFNNAVSEVVVGANAEVNHVRIQRDGLRSFHVGTISARLAPDAVYRSHALSEGARLARVDLDCTLEGEGAEVSLNGLYLGKNRQHTDHHTYVDHIAPHTSSRELYKGILDDRARAVFNGRVIIRPDAQGVQASQTNNNLLLSEEALVNTNPELEIFADDVQAQHGATIGQLEEDQLFYLRSRGIREDLARRLLIHAFAGDMVDRLGVEDVATGARALLEARF